jgi:hypothetical protein
MIKYELKYENLILRNIHQDFKIVDTTDNSVIEKCIDFFNSEIQWDGMFDINEALYRIQKGEKIFVGYKNQNIFCYCWIRQDNEQSYYIYNVFSKKPTSLRKIGVIDLLYSAIKYHTNGKITVDIDEWNTKSQKVAEKLGFTTKNKQNLI